MATKTKKQPGYVYRDNADLGNYARMLADAAFSMYCKEPYSRLYLEGFRENLSIKTLFTAFMLTNSPGSGSITVIPVSIPKNIGIDALTAWFHDHLTRVSMINPADSSMPRFGKENE